MSERNSSEGELSMEPKSIQLSMNESLDHSPL